MLSPTDKRGTVTWTLKVLQVSGMWPPRSHSSYYKVYSVVTLGSLYFTYMLSEMINMILVFDDIEEVTDASFLLLTHLAQIPKVYCFFKYEPRIRAMVDIMNHKKFSPRNTRQDDIARKMVRQMQAILVVYLSMCASTVILWAIFPLTEANKERRLPLKAWIPFDTKKSPNYEVAYTFQIIAVMADALSNASLDMVPTGFMAYICMQLDVLYDVISHVRLETEISLAKKQKRLEAGKSEKASDVDFHEHAAEILVDCLEYHLFIIE